MVSACLIGKIPPLSLLRARFPPRCRFLLQAADCGKARPFCSGFSIRRLQRRGAAENFQVGECETQGISGGMDDASWKIWKFFLCKKTNFGMLSSTNRRIYKKNRNFSWFFDCFFATSINFCVQGVDISLPIGYNGQRSQKDGSSADVQKALEKEWHMGVGVVFGGVVHA